MRFHGRHRQIRQRCSRAGIQASQTTPLVSRGGKTVGMITHALERAASSVGTGFPAARHPGAAGGRSDRAHAGRGSAARQRAPAERSRSTQGRIPRDTGPRAAQSAGAAAHEPGADPDRGQHAGGRSRKSARRWRSSWRCSCAWLTICSTCRGSRRGRFGCSAGPRNLRRSSPGRCRPTVRPLMTGRSISAIDMPEYASADRCPIPTRFVQVDVERAEQCGQVHRSGRTHQHLR